MEDEELQAQTSELVNYDDVAEQEIAEPDTNDFGFDETEDADVKVEDAVAPQTQEMTKEERAQNAAMRRLAEKKAIEENAYKKGQMEAFIGTLNPYTGEEIKDSLDIAEYKAMIQIDKNGGDPIVDYSKHIKSQERKTELDKGENAEEKRERFIDEDAKKFISSHPELDTTKLMTDNKFIKYSSARIGNESMETIYADYLELVSEFDSVAENKANRLFAKKAASPGSLQNNGADRNSYETMSDADFDKKLAAVLSGREKI